MYKKYIFRIICLLVSISILTCSISAAGVVSNEGTINEQTIEIPVVSIDEIESGIANDYWVPYSTDGGLVFLRMTRQSSTSTYCSLDARYVSTASYAASALRYSGLTIKDADALVGTVYYAYNQTVIPVYFNTVSSAITVPIGTYSIPTGVDAVSITFINLQAYINSLATWVSVVCSSAYVEI